MNAGRKGNLKVATEVHYGIITHFDSTKSVSESESDLGFKEVTLI